MPRATIASRQLKNKDTGLDLIVPTYKEIKGLMSSTVYYQVVLVSNLACFKTPSHKPSDVVQYSIEKQWSEFEELKIRLSEIFPGTVMPVLNKKSIIVNETVLRERRNNLDQFLKFLTSVSKLATCAPVLQFLGVDAARAKRFSQGEPLETTTPRSTDEEKQEGNTEENESEAYVFEDDLDGQPDTDLFDEAEENFGDGDVVGAGGNRAQVSMFEEQDMKWEMTEEDEKDFGFVPDAIITKRVSIDFDENEDNSDLFTIEDDLDKLMTIGVSKKEKQQKEEKLSPPSSSPPPPAVKPKAPPKPTPAPKPSISNSQAKPTSAGESRDTTTKSSSSATQANKPKPAPKPRPTNSQAANSAESDIKTTSPGKPAASASITDSGNMEKLDQDDILKYLQDNLAADTDEVDLFS